MGLGSEHERCRRRVLGVGREKNAVAGEEGDGRRSGRGGAEVGEGAPMTKALIFFLFRQFPLFLLRLKPYGLLVFGVVDRFSAL